MAAHETTPAAPKSRRRRWRRAAVVAVLLLFALVLAPYAIAFGPVRDWIAGRASTRLGAPCRIDALAWSWTRGVAATGIEIANPPGFATERPCLRLAHANVDLLRGLRLAPEARLERLELFVEQRADGTTNVQQLGVRSAPTAPGGEPPPPGGDGRDPLPPFDLELVDGRIEFRRDGELLETAANVHCRVQRAAGATATRVTAGADLAAGRTTLSLQHGDDGSAHVEFGTPGLDLGRWAPLLDLFARDRVTTLAGRATGDVVADLRAGGELAVQGRIDVLEPRLGGPLLRGMTLGGERWSLVPAIALATGGAVDASGLAIDLGWFTLRGLPADAATPGTFAARCELDVAALAEFGGPMPESLRGSGTRLGGELRVPIADRPTDAEGWLRAVAATLRLEVPRLDLAGFELTGAVNGELRDGVFTCATEDSTRLDAGALGLEARVELAAEDLPVRAAVRWREGRLHGGTAAALRYAVPLLAGLDAANAPLTGLCDLALELAGPARRGDQNLLAWLDAWSGNGEVGLREASFAPAAALQGLLQPLGALPGASALGDQGRLAIDSFTAPFSFEHGAVHTTASSWLAKGNRIGLAGSVRFDGTLDYEFDLSALLRGHRDGERVLQLLGGALPPAQLRGQLDAPRLELPELGGVLQKVVEDELERRGRGLLDRALDDILRRR